MEFLSVFGVRLLLPIINFSSNVLLLGYFGVDRFAVLATLLQGCLLATVLLKFGADDALLYGGSDSQNDSRRLQPEILLGLFGIVAVVVLASRAPPNSNLLTSGLQILILGFLNARLVIAAMRLQVRGYVWIGNLAQSIAAPLAAIVGAEFLPYLCPDLASKGASLLFFFSIGFGFFFWLFLLSLLLHFLDYQNKRNDVFVPSPGHSTINGVTTTTRSLWMLQIIDVLLISGDLILLGFFSKLEGLGHYVAASRLAVASTFVLLAIEQSLATIQRSGRQLRVPFWLVLGIMLIIVPIYILFLSLLGIRANLQYDLLTLIMLMSVAALQTSFLRSKVRWAGQVGVDPLHNKILFLMAMVVATSSVLFWLSFQLEMEAATRAASFGALAIVTRWVLLRCMNQAVEASVAKTRRRN